MVTKNSELPELLLEVTHPSDFDRPYRGCDERARLKGRNRFKAQEFGFRLIITILAMLRGSAVLFLL